MMSGTTPVSQEFARTPLPAFQVLAMYEAALGSVKLKPYFNGYWQRVGRAGDGHHPRRRWGAAPGSTCTSGR